MWARSCATIQQVLIKSLFSGVKKLPALSRNAPQVEVRILVQILVQVSVEISVRADFILVHVLVKVLVQVLV